jgi:hypothetical protein
MTAKTHAADPEEPTMIAIRPPFFGLRNYFAVPTLGITFSAGLRSRQTAQDTAPRREIRSPRLDAPTLGIPGGGHIPAKLTYR